MLTSRLEVLLGKRLRPARIRDADKQAFQRARLDMTASDALTATYRYPWQKITDLDIRRGAGVLIKQYGQDAPIHAAMRADAMREAGDLDGLAVWKRILRAVEELQETVPKSGEAVH